MTDENPSNQEQNSPQDPASEPTVPGQAWTPPVPPHAQPTAGQPATGQPTSEQPAAGGYAGMGTGGGGNGDWNPTGSLPYSTPVQHPPKTSNGGGFVKWIAVVLVSALIGGIVGAVVAHNDKNDSSKVVSSTTAATPQEISQPATPDSIRSVLAKVQPAVVSIQTQISGGTGNGTGMIVSSDGMILTNAHVVNGGSNIQVTLNGSKTSIAAKLLGMDTSIDCAIIKIDGQSNLPTVTFGESSQIQVGDEVVAIGNALALPGGPSVTSGIISAKDRDIDDDQGVTLNNLLQTDAAINPGNSGGPLVNMAGQVIGMNTAVIRGDSSSGNDFQNIGFALSIDTVKPAISDLESGKVRQQALLGVTAVTLDDNIRTTYQLTPKQGAVIDTVTANGPADKAGLSRFDVITQVDQTPITSSDDLTAAIRAHSPGDKVKITYYRGSDQLTTNATLGVLPAASATPSTTNSNG